MKLIHIKNISLTIVALVAAFALTARANGPGDLISSAAPSHGASPSIKTVQSHPFWSDDIIYDNGGPDQQNGNEMTAWIQAEDFNLSADSTLGVVNFWDIEAPGGTAYQGEIDWSIYADAGGQPGATIASGAAVGAAVTRTFTQCCVLGFYDEYAVSFNVTPGVALTAGTTYWLGLHNGPLSFVDRTEFYWETTSYNGTFTGHEDNAPFDGSWADNGSEHAFNLASGGGGGIVLNATVRRQQGNHVVALRWSPADGGSVNILRNGAVLHGPTDDDGSAQDNVGHHSGTVTYQVCETDTGDCSNVVTVTINPPPGN